MKTTRLHLRFAAGLLALTTLATLQAQPISVPNSSFESQSGSGLPFDTTPFLDAWQKIAEPAYYAPTVGAATGVPWFGTSGAFINASVYNPSPYGNVTGAQAGYILAFPQVTLFQDYDNSPGFDATFEVGKAYNLTLAIFGKSRFAGAMQPGSTFEMSLYYRDALDNRVPVSSTVITYNPADFPTTPVLNLVDYQVNTYYVQAGDAWAGKHIGIELKSTLPLELAVFGSWDFDNLRLTAVPEPSAMALLGLGGVVLARFRRRN